MKITKMSLANIQSKLSRAEMKNIMAGSGGAGQEHHEYCDTGISLNCCNGLVCAEHKCQYRTLA